VCCVYDQTIRTPASNNQVLARSGVTRMIESSDAHVSEACYTHKRGMSQTHTPASNNPVRTSLCARVNVIGANACMCVCACRCVWSVCMCVSVCVCVACLSLYVYTYIYVYMYTYISIYTYIYMYIYIYIYTCTCMYIFSYIYTDI